MSAIDPTAALHGHAGDHAHGEADDHGHTHAHPPHLAHHFDTPEQQYDSAKLGMWTFLATEILMFGGLFCAYAVYRYNNPGVFRIGEGAVDTTWGAINTIILLTSSLTMALGVRAAQLGQKNLLVGMLLATLLGGAGFMVVKTIEYKSKWDHGLFPGFYNSYARELNPEGFQKNVVAHWGEHGEEDNAAEGEDDAEHGPPGGGGSGEGHAAQDPAGHGAAPETEQQGPGTETDLSHPATQPTTQPATQSGVAPLPSNERMALIGPGYIDPHVGTGDAAKIRPRFNTTSAMSAAHAGDGHATVSYTDLSIREQSNVKAFFNIYFLMTGLHGLHVLIGMGLITWITIKAWAGTFGPAYFTPVDLVGLYWHLVDLIWIFLFPLLYLIH